MLRRAAFRRRVCAAARIRAWRQEHAAAELLPDAGCVIDGDAQLHA